MIVITGGAGFIGSAIIAALNKRGITDILVVDELACDQKWKNLQNLAFADYLEKSDFLKMVTENKIDSNIKAVFHMGACSSTTETNASYLVKNNYEYSKLLAQWTTDADIRFIYASSAATYGDGAEGFSDNEEQIYILRPLNMYGYSKQLLDLWVHRMGLLKKIFGKSKAERLAVLGRIQERFSVFKDLLDRHNQSLRMISQLEEKLINPPV